MREYMGEKVSIVMPTYNRGYVISDAIDSIIEQSYKDWELIIVDDGSTDDTATLVAKYQKKYDNIIYFDNMDNKGACARRNEGIKYSTGVYIAFIDSDNYWHPEKLKKQMTVLQKNDCDFCFCNVKIIDGNSSFIVPKQLIEKEFLCKKLLRENIIDTNSLLITKDKIIKAGLFDEEMPRLQDYELVFRLIYNENAKFCHLNEVLVTNNLQKDSITKNSKLYVKALSIFLNKHGQLIPEEDKVVWVAKLLLSNGWNTNEGRYVLNNTLNDSIFCCKVLNYFVDVFTSSRYEIDILNKWTDADWNIIKKEFQNKKVAIYGAGKYGKKTIKKFKELGIEITCVIDKNGGEIYDGYLVKYPDEVHENIDIIVISILRPDEELIAQIRSKYNSLVLELSDIILKASNAL